MILDENMLKAFYSTFSERVAKARKVLGRPMAYAEKVLYAHLLMVVSFTLTTGARVMLVFVPTEWPCRMPQPRWRCCSL